MWIGRACFEELTGLGRSKSAQALSRALDGHMWRGHLLDVRRVDRRGSLEVNVKSLPSDLQRAFERSLTVTSLPVVPEPPARPSGDREFKRSVILPMLDMERGTPERAAMIRREAARERTKPDGSRGTVPERTIRRWLAAYEECGELSLCKRPRIDRGARRVHVSRAWDGAVPFCDETKAAIAKRLEAIVKRSFADGMMGRNRVAARASRSLIAMTAEHARGTDWTPSNAELQRVCRVPSGFVQRHKAFGQVAEYRRDRKAFEDRRPYRIRTHGRDQLPSGVVFGDVHHMDVLLVREDGSTATPKAIVWMDVATNRVRMDLELYGKGESVRREHVARSFMAMASDPTWGLPSTLYIDNGSEYGLLDFVSHAMELAQTARAGAPFQPPVVKSYPYRPQGKGRIEGFFGNFERFYLCELPGYIAGDRMKKPTANLGKPPEPFPGDLATFARAVNALLAEYHDARQRSATLQGQSPHDTYTAHVEAGWQPVLAERSALEAAFVQVETRTVRQGGFDLDGSRYAFEFDRWPLDLEAVELHVPLVGPADRVWVYGGNDFLGTATIDRPRAILDPRNGADRKRQRAAARLVREAERTLPSVTGHPAAIEGANVIELPTARPLTTVRLDRDRADAADRVEADRERERREDEETRRALETNRNEFFENFGRQGVA